MNEKAYVQIHYGISIYTEVCLTPNTCALLPYTLLCLLLGDIPRLTQVNKMKPKYMDLEVAWGNSERNLDLSLEDLGPDSSSITWQHAQESKSLHLCASVASSVKWQWQHLPHLFHSVLMRTEGDMVVNMVPDSMGFFYSFKTLRFVFLFNGRPKIEIRKSSGDNNNIFLKGPWSWGRNLKEVEGNRVFWCLKPAEHHHFKDSVP